MPGRERELAQNLQVVGQRIADAASAAGRSRDELTLIAVTKYFPAQDVRILQRLGITDIGENKDQEAAAKVADLEPAIRARLRVHFIGQLQTNKANRVARYADVVQSVDRDRLAQALDRGAQAAQRTLEVLVQVDLSGQPGRGGVAPADLDELLDVVTGAPALDLRGLMAVAPLGQPPDPAFERLAGLAEQYRDRAGRQLWISAGMSGDLESAVAHGATHLRVGSAILGKRPPQR